MPLRPDFSQHRPDRRLDSFRDRVGRPFRAQEAVGYVLVKVEPRSRSTSGHLWWRRWDESRDVLWVWTLVDGKFSDSLVPGDATEEELAAYRAGRFPYYGELLCVTWLDADESESVRFAEFGEQAAVPDG